MQDMVRDKRYSEMQDKHRYFNVKQKIKLKLNVKLYMIYGPSRRTFWMPMCAMDTVPSATKCTFTVIHRTVRSSGISTN